MCRLWPGTILAAVAVLCGRPAAAQIGPVSVTGGQVQGVTVDGITSFKGIPFAAPPVGDLRWREPQPVTAWQGTRLADHFGPSCMQKPKALEQFGLPPVMGEDCLYLNVWTPARSGHDRLPVIVWIYGGAFTYGSTATPAYDGTSLAKQGVVLVSIAYRTGVFGFLADPGLSAESPHHVSGNYALRDMIAALKWVRANIGRFGGDPGHVTILGESAGGDAVSLLAISPAAKGLFQRVICESGAAALAPVKFADTSYTDSGPPLRSLAAAEGIGHRFLARLGAQDIAAARALPADAIQQASSPMFGDDGAYYWPVIDGEIIPGAGSGLYQAGHFNDTPVLIGTNVDEGGFPPEQADYAGTTPEKFEAHVRAAFGKHADPILTAYPHATTAQAQQASGDLFFRDAGFVWESRAWALMQSRKGHGKAYLYYFGPPRSPDLPFGPVHGSELGYVFGNSGGPIGLPHFPPGPQALALSNLMQTYWVNFAKTGDPNGPGLPIWPAFSASSQQVMYLDTDAHSGAVPNLRQLEALDAYFEWLRVETSKQ